MPHLHRRRSRDPSESRGSRSRGRARLPGRSRRGKTWEATLGTTWATLLLAVPALAQQPANAPLPTADFRVDWYQPQDLSGAGEWEVEVTPFGDAGATFVARANAFPVDSCWGLDVPAATPSLVRIRKGSAEAWSEYTAVPEPSLSSAIGVGLLWLGVIGRHAPQHAANRQLWQARPGSERDCARMRRRTTERLS